MAGLRRAVGALVMAAMTLPLVLLLFAGVRGRRQDMPWTPLDLSQPIGLFTGRKIAGLGGDFAECRALLDTAGVRYTVSAPVAAGRCGYADGIRFDPGGARRIALSPPRPVLACPVAAALAVWEWQVVQPAARRYLGQRVIGIEHLGSYNCRSIHGRAGPLSEHATADAIDIAGFLLADGSRVSVLGDWRDRGDRGTFLRMARNGACGLFSTVLSPDYNAAHADHLHLDQAARGRIGWRACR